MSPRWTDRVNVALAPRAAACAVWSRGWSAQPRARSVLPCRPDPQAPTWRPAVDVLRKWVKKRARNNAEVRVVLSNHFLRYQVVPWQADLSGRAERKVLAQRLFQETYGDHVGSWHVQLGALTYGRPALACAIDREFYDALIAVFAGTSLRLGALQPLLMVAFNQLLSQIGNDACLFVREPGRLCCAVVRAGQWHAIHALRIGADADVERLIKRQISVLGLGPEVPVLVFDAALALLAEMQ